MFTEMIWIPFISGQLIRTVDWLMLVSAGLEAAWLAESWYLPLDSVSASKHTHTHAWAQCTVLQGDSCDSSIFSFLFLPLSYTLSGGGGWRAFASEPDWAASSCASLCMAAMHTWVCIQDEEKSGVFDGYAVRYWLYVSGFLMEHFLIIS